MSSYSYSSTSYSYSSTTTGSNGETQTTGTRQATRAYRDPTTGETTVQSASQNLGEPVVQDTRRYDDHGRELIGGSGAGARAIEGGNSGPRIEDVTDRDARNAQEAEAEKQYLERMEDEYAKREGGA